ncbi:MAG TPA: hypothetical protein VGI39_46075 [Polyangiaceae bacterium]
MNHERHGSEIEFLSEAALDLFDREALDLARVHLGGARGDERVAFRYVRHAPWSASADRFGHEGALVVRKLKGFRDNGLVVAAAS